MGMIYLQNLNPITIVLIIIMTLPLISGIFMEFSREGVRGTLWSLADNIIFILGMFSAIYLTKRIFFDHRGDFFDQIYYYIPLHIRTILYGQDVLIYLGAGTIILFLLLVLMRPFLLVMYRAILNPLADALYTLLSKGGPLLRVFMGVLVQLPRAAFAVLLVGLTLNFFSYCFPSPILSQCMNNSGLYHTVYQDVLCPVLNSNLAKKIPVIVSDAFAQTINKEMLAHSNPEPTISLDQTGPSSTKERVIEYFNGVTIDSAVHSTPRIDETAVDIVGNQENSKQKAYLIYQWVSTNISYDYDKAAKLASDPRGINSGSIIAFTERKGVCFDYSSLYVSMCRAVGLKVRLVTGLAYSGTAWGDHAWNQVYLPEENRWINIDTTFGIYADYFDKADFIADHRNAEVQGEW